MATINLQIAATADDGFLDTSTGWDTLQQFVSFGDGITGGERRACLRFTNVTVPHGATVNSASAVFTCYAASVVDGVNLNIYANAEDDAVAPTSTATCEAKTQTTAVVNWAFDTDWAINSEYTTPDIAAIIQEVVNRAGWVSGNAIMVIVRDNNSAVDARRASYDYTNTPGKSAKLNITYSVTVGGGSTGGKGKGGKKGGGTGSPTPPPGKLKAFGVGHWNLGNRRWF